MYDLNRSTGSVSKTTGNRHHLMQLYPADHGHSLRHVYRAPYGRRRPALALGNAHAHSRLHQILRVRISDTLLNFFFGAALGGNWILDERLRRNVAVFVNLTNRVQIRLAPNPDIQSIPGAQSITSDSLLVY